MMAGSQAGSGRMTEQTAHQDNLARLWEEHMRHEFETQSTEDTIATMVEDAYVNHIPVMTGGVGPPAVRPFYPTHLLPHMPPDLPLTPTSHTHATEQLVAQTVIH